MNSRLVSPTLIACFIYLGLAIFSLPLYGQDINGNLHVGTLQKIHSDILEEDRFLWIHLPQDYENGLGHYPVLFVLDGGWPELFMEAISSAAYLQVSIDAPPFIIVGVANTQRNRDLMPKAIGGRPGSGGADEFCQFLDKELIPYIRHKYRTNYYNILYGGSTAGLFTIYALLENPETFNAYIASSPMIGYCMELMTAKTSHFLEADRYKGKILYMNYGKKDLDRVRLFLPRYYRILERKAPGSLRMSLKYLETEGHVPFGSLYDGLRFVFK